MKKLPVLLVCMLCGLKCLIANPLPIPSVDITELMFDAEKGWMLEFNCLGMPEVSIVKLTVASSSGSAESNYLPVFEGGEFEWIWERFVLTRDSMKSDLNINPLGDKITVITEYYWEGDEYPDYYEDILIFGNYQGSKINAPSEGQSIGYVGYRYCECDVYYYAKTNEPTMGEPNNTSKMKGTVTGKIYDKNDQLLQSNETMTFACYYNDCDYGGAIYPFVSVENGAYSINVFANRLSNDYIFLSNKRVKIKSIKIDVEPDEVVEQDIYLLEDFTDIKAVSIKDNSPVRIFPNPLSGGQELQYEVGAPVKSLDCRMEIVSMEGHLVFEGKITDNIGAVTLPHSLPSGTYIVNFKFNNKTQYATRLIIGK